VLAPLAKPATPADQFDRLIEGLCRAVAARAGRGLAGPLVILVWSRLRRMALRFASLAERLRRLPPRPAACRPGHSGPPPPKLPRGSAWLVRLVPEAAASASQLQHLLADPELASLLAAAPPLGRILRPLCRMLGVPPPPHLARPAPRAAAASPLAPGEPPGPAQVSAPPSAPPRPRPPPMRRRRDGTGWVPRRRMFAWPPPSPA
jgi:hypothetical protein